MNNHSEEYFDVKKEYFDGGVEIEMTEFEHDLKNLSPKDRIEVELKIMEFHTPKMAAVDVDMTLNAGPRTIEDMLKELCD